MRLSLQETVQDRDLRARHRVRPDSDFILSSQERSTERVVTAAQ
jgi:hypothetical protein